MASTTPYKDELIRIAALMGLPDDTDPTTVAEAVATLQAARLDAEAKWMTALERLRLAATDARTSATSLRQRRERAGSAQAFADMSDVADRLDRVAEVYEAPQ